MGEKRLFHRDALGEVSGFRGFGVSGFVDVAAAGDCDVIGE